jgi:hypothetical protein
MPHFTTSTTFSDGQQITSELLNGIVINLRLGDDSVDGTTVTLSGGGALSVGVLASANYGSGSVLTVALGDSQVTAAKLAADAVETAKIKDAAVTGAKIAADTIPFTKTLPDDRATKTDMQSQTAAHWVTPDVLKYHPLVPKVIGNVAFSNGSAAVTGSVNVASAADLGDSRRITLTTAFANTDYVIHASCNGGTTPVIWTKVNASQFILEGPSEASGRVISFVGFGELAS